MRLLAAVLLLSAAWGAAQAAPEAIAIWHMDQFDQGLIRDATGNGHDAKPGGKEGARPKLVPGLAGQALEFKPEQETFLQVADAPELNLRGPFTVMAWIKPATTRKTYAILCKRGDPSREKVGAGWRLRDFWGRPSLDLATGQEKWTLSGDRWTLPAGFWSHVAASFDGQVARLYVNAVQIAEGSPPGPPAPYKRPLIIGNYIGRKNAYAFDGLLDEAKIFKGALTQEEIFQQARF